jgi:glucoamylase
MASLPAAAVDAFGAPGMPARHAPAVKSFLGTAVDGASRVYFTGHRGILSEVFYPSVDSPQTVDLQFLVADGAGRFVDEEKRQVYLAKQSGPRTMSWNVATSSHEHQWRIDKLIFTAPERHALIERVTFRALGGKRLRDFKLYLLFKPALDNRASDNSARSVAFGRGTALVSAGRQSFAALATSLPWQSAGGRRMVSSGYVGSSDGWTDLLGGTADRRMDWTFDAAARGNVAQMGLIDLGAGDASEVSFDLVLAFGRSQDEALGTLQATLGDNLAAQQARYDSGWWNYAAGLSNQGGLADARYYLAAMTLKSAFDKDSGAMVAGLGTPWGESQGEDNAGGYHLVWPRDLFKFANALYTAGDRETPRRVVRFLFETLQQQSDCGRSENDAAGCPGGFSRIGRFPQNAWVSGRAYWPGTQMDEQAMPLLLAWRLGPGIYTPLWPRIRQSADYVAATGPRTMQERWEENGGYSPSTLAAEIAGLVAAAEMANQIGDQDSAARYLERADSWWHALDNWTFTTRGTLGNGRYYLRINPSAADANRAPQLGPDNAQTLTIANGGGQRDARTVIDSGFMELVRLGIKRADDPAIRSTLAVFDQVLGQSLPLANPVALPRNAWFRYNYDGYGEHNDGRDYDGSGSGRGRLWPILTAERGMLDIAQSGRGASGEPYLQALRQFATPEGFLPEQVWPHGTVQPGDWQVALPPGATAGTPTRSIAPLNWAMGEYISLLASIRLGRIADLPEVVCRRYQTCTPAPAAGQSVLDVRVDAPQAGDRRWYITGNQAALGHWNPAFGLPLLADADGYWRRRLLLPGHRGLRYIYYSKDGKGRVQWETPPTQREVSVPTNGSLRKNDRVD